MLEGDCKVESLCIRIENGVGAAFFEECFGVTIEVSSVGTICRATDESIEVIWNYKLFFNDFLETACFLTTVKKWTASVLIIDMIYIAAV